MNARSTTHTEAGTETRGRIVEQMALAFRLLASGRWQAEDLAGALGCQKRTVYRLFHALERVGVPLERQAEGKEAYYRIVWSRLVTWLRSADHAEQPKKGGSHD